MSSSKVSGTSKRQAVENFADDLVALGDLNGLLDVFGTKDPNFDLNTFTDTQIDDIYTEYLTD